MVGDDRLLELLLEMARDGFSSVFARDEDEPVELGFIRGYWWLPGGAFRAREHPAYGVFMEALVDDPQFNIFAGASEPFIESSSGYGSLIQTGSLPGLLIASASASHVARGRPIHDLDAFLDEVARSFETLRRLIAGEETEALTVVAVNPWSPRPRAASPLRA